MKAKFVHVGFQFSGPVPVDEITVVFGSALDWLRYAPNCWIIYTTTEIDTWRDRLKADAKISNGQFFLCEFEPTSSVGYSGWMRQGTWEWITKDRSK